MTDEAKRIVDELRRYASAHSDTTYGVFKYVVGTDEILREAANLIEKLSVALDRVTEDDNFQRKCVGDLYAQMNQLIHQRDSWRRRAEAAERDLHSAITADVGCALCAHRHECNGCDNEGICTKQFEFGTCPAMKDTPCNGCDFENHWRWRGPCAENGGAK